MNSLRKVKLRDYTTLTYYVKTKRTCSTASSSTAKLYEPADEETRIKERLEPLVKKPRRPPFVKNLFGGSFDNELLAYPEFLGEGRLKLLDFNTKILKKFVSENIDSKEIDTICNIPEKVMEALRSLKLFGVSASSAHGGLELTYSERARVYEVLANDPSVAAMLFSCETLGYKVIDRYGSDEQKRKYLKDLATGKKIAAYCCNEPKSGSDLAEAETYAVETSEEYLITGKKCWVMNADSADVFIVFVKPKTQIAVHNPLNVYYSEAEEMVLPDDLAAVVVDRNAPGITVSERKDTIGFRGLHMCDVTFNNTPIKETDVLGTWNQGYDIARDFLAEDRHLLGCIALTTLRNLMNEATKFSIDKKLYGDSLCNYGLTQKKLSDMALHIYAIESMVYYTCGLKDMYEDQDCEVENAIVKVYSSRVAWKSVCDGMQILGGKGYLRNTDYERYFRDLKILSIFDVSDEVLKTFIALSGLKHVANRLNNEVYTQRNQLSYPKAAYARYFKRLSVDEDNPSLVLKLFEDLHPSCVYIADMLEYCILRFEWGINQALARSGITLVNDQYALDRIAESAILIYAMTACVSRASRAYCIGAKNADEEMVLAETIIRRYHEEFRAVVEGLTEGEYFVPDANSKKIADRVIHSTGYFAQDPLELTY